MSTCTPAKTQRVFDPAVKGGASSASAFPPAEFVELVENARKTFSDSDKLENPPVEFAGICGIFQQPAVYPACSLLADWMEFARSQEESADAFLLGAIMPICAAALTRKVWFKWGMKRKFANIFSILVGKPADRKSSCISLAETVARQFLPTTAFLPDSFSPEALFDEYAEEEGGRADKLWIVGDANPALKDWQKSVNGERVAGRFLRLYDCTSISERFRRNKDETASGNATRSVPETSTSLLFSATFNIAAFQGQEVRAGMARRFLYYVAERHGRLIVRPGARDESAVATLVEGFRDMLTLAGEVDFTPEAADLWGDVQRENREEIDTIDPLREGEIARLGSAPM